MLLLILSALAQVLHLRYHPIKDNIEQRIIFFNELMTSLYLYLNIVLTDFNGDNPLRDYIGLSLLILMIITFLVNLIKTFFKVTK